MNKIISLLLVALLSKTAFSQVEKTTNISYIDSLEGKWEGEFFDHSTLQKVSINLVIKRKKKHYKIFSYSYFENKMAVCEVDLRKIRADSICLTEFARIKRDSSFNCRQIMYLHISKKLDNLIMTGIWEPYENATWISCGKGIIQFIKKQ